MSERWKYGNYEFRVNPSSSDQSIEFVGDNVRTLTGALISQPTSMVENYSVSSVFYQPRSRLLSQFSIPNGICFEYYNGLFYAINDNNDAIDMYNENFTFVNSLSLASLTAKTYLALDVISTGIWVISDGTTNYTLYKINFNGTIASTKTVAKVPGEALSGIEELSGFLFILKDSTIDQYALPSVTKIDTIFLPSILYSGLSSDGTYLITSQFDDYNNNVIYHIDHENGKIISSIYSSEIGAITNVTYNGQHFYILNSNVSTIQKVYGNTVLVDIYNLEKQIDRFKFVIMVDDLGTERRVRIESMSAQRRVQNEVSFDVSLRINKINRG